MHGARAGRMVANLVAVNLSKKSACAPIGHQTERRAMTEQGAIVFLQRSVGKAVTTEFQAVVSWNSRPQAP